MQNKIVIRLLAFLLVGLILLGSIMVLAESAYAATNIPNLTQLLREGSRGNQVKYLQEKLNALGFNAGTADGIFGAKTKSAVKSFQKANKLVVDGIVGAATRGKLNSSSSSTKPETKPDPKPDSSIPNITQLLREGSRGNQVKYLQEKLNALGFNAGTADGIFGAKTKSAVKSFQKANKLVVDGIVGAATRGKLNSSSSSTKPETKPDPKPDSSIPNITQLLREGSKGNQVKYLQEKLNALGFNAGTADGIFGAKTKSAVMSFQKANKLVVDGIVGAATRGKLNSSSSSTKPETKPDPKPDEDITDIKPKPGELQGKTIIIDPGHGGSDSGTSRNNVYEKNLTLDMSLRLESILKKTGANVIMTRRSDTYSYLFYRSAIANKHIVDTEIGKLESTVASSRVKVEDSESQINNLNAEIKELISEISNKTKELDEIKDLEGKLDNSNDVNKNNLLDEIARLEELREEKEVRLEEINNETNIEELTDEEIIEEAEKLKNDIEILDKEASELNDKINNIGSDLEKEKEISIRRQALEKEISISESEKKELERNIQDIEAENKDISLSGNNNIDTKLSDLRNKSNLLQNNINNPSLTGRSWLYSLINGNRVNPQLGEIFDLTRDSYEDNIIFISVHINSTGDVNTTASGVQVYYRPNNSPVYTTYSNYYNYYNDNKRLKLAQSMLKNTTANAGFKGTWTKPLIGDFSVIREQNLPSVLMEIGFMNNSNDRTLLEQGQTRENIAKGMYLGIVEYFQK